MLSDAKKAAAILLASYDYCHIVETVDVEDAARSPRKLWEPGSTTIGSRFLAVDKYGNTRRGGQGKASMIAMPDRQDGDALPRAYCGLVLCKSPGDPLRYVYHGRAECGVKDEDDCSFCLEAYTAFWKNADTHHVVIQEVEPLREGEAQYELYCLESGRSTHHNTGIDSDISEIGLSRHVWYPTCFADHVLVQ